MNTNRTVYVTSHGRFAWRVMPEHRARLVVGSNDLILTIEDFWDIMPFTMVNTHVPGFPRGYLLEENVLLRWFDQEGIEPSGFHILDATISLITDFVLETLPFAGHAGVPRTGHAVRVDGDLLHRYLLENYGHQLNITSRPAPSRRP